MASRSDIRPFSPILAAARMTPAGRPRYALRWGEAAVGTGPGDELAAVATGRGRLRASDADRERVIDALKAAFVQGLLAKDEFDRRAGRALAARTYAELAALTADLTAEPIAAKPPKAARAPGRHPVLGPGRVAAAATALYAGVWVYAPLSPAGGDNPVAGQLVWFGGIVYVLVLLTVMFIAVDRRAAVRQAKRSGGQPPRPPSARPDTQFLPSDHGHQLPYGPRPVQVPG
jgi:DUF1707 SHOCT-like domain